VQLRQLRQLLDGLALLQLLAMAYMPGTNAQVAAWTSTHQRM
jgi:hypothetical protein